MAQMQLLQEPLAPGDIVYTPDWVARDMVSWFQPVGKILEPCKGDGAILKYMPSADWCEIQEGRDFFQWSRKVDWIITNPPYSLVPEFLKHSLDIAKNVVFLVPLHSFFRSGGLMKTCKDYGWIKHIRFYGAGGKLGFPMGNPIAAMHFVVSYVGDTSWSWYAPNTASTRPLVRAAKKAISKSSASSVKQAGSHHPQVKRPVRWLFQKVKHGN